MSEQLGWITFGIGMGGMIVSGVLINAASRMLDVANRELEKAISLRLPPTPAIPSREAPNE